MSDRLKVTYLNDGIRHFGTWYDRVCAHHTVGILLSDFRNQECTHSGTSASTKRVGDLETCMTRQKDFLNDEVVVSNLEGSQCPQPPYGQHQGRSQPAPLPRCNL